MSTAAFFVKPEVAAEMKGFYQRLSKHGTAPLWEVLGQVLTREPQTSCKPALWCYEEIRPLLMESGKLITAREAERRVLVLENPAMPGAAQITQSLFAGLQLILPGEVAPSHRHVISALRFVIESEGAYTAVDGERTTMRPGDFILTPNWTFHDHGNPSDKPAVWLDGLDFPIVKLFGAGFAEHHTEEMQPIRRQEGDAPARYGANLLPVEYTSAGLSAPVFTYPYARSRQVLDQLYRNGPIHPCHGVKMRYVNPATGGYPIPTIAAFLQLLPSGFRGSAYRSTDATVYCVVEGRGRSEIGAGSFAWKEHDIFVVPSWCSVFHEAHEEAVLFSFSDRAAQKAFGLWREQTLE